MPFVQIKGLTGKVYVPECAEAPKKHRCPDCFECQHCGDDRCQVCLGSRAKGGESGSACGKCKGGCDSAGPSAA